MSDGTIERITNNRARTIDPTWSPDGEAIAFSSNIRGGEDFDIYIVDISDPKKPKQTDITQGDFGNRWQRPLWAPAGEQPRIIAEKPDLPGGQAWDVVLLDLTGGELEVINISNATGEGAGIDGDAAWSPDGTKVVFKGGRQLGEIQLGKFNIFIAITGEIKSS